MSQSFSEDSLEKISQLDDELSKRFIALDPSGYFLIKVDFLAQEIVVEHFSNDLDESGRAIDPETGEVLGCRGGERRTPLATFRAASAKQMGMLLTEGEDGPRSVTRLDHALYLGRELQRAQNCLVTGNPYVQD